MCDLDEWDDEDIMTFHELIAATRRAKYSIPEESLLKEISKLDKFRIILKKFSFKKLDNLDMLLTDLIIKRQPKERLENQDNT